MDSDEFIQLMKQIEEKNISMETVTEKTKVSQNILNLYARSGPVPVTLINTIKKILEEAA